MSLPKTGHGTWASRYSLGLGFLRWSGWGLKDSGARDATGSWEDEAQGGGEPEGATAPLAASL